MVLLAARKQFVACMGRHGGMADAMDSKSIVRKDVWVQVPLPAKLIFLCFLLTHIGNHDG